VVRNSCFPRQKRESHKSIIPGQRGDELIEHARIDPGNNQEDDNNNKEDRKGHANVAEQQAPKRAGAPGRAGMADLCQGGVAGDDSDQPQAKGQDIQDGGENGADATRENRQQEADGEVKTPLQEIKEPAEQAEGQAGAGESIGGGVQVEHREWVATTGSGLVEVELFFTAQLLLDAFHHQFERHGLINEVDIVGADGEDRAEVEGEQPIVVEGFEQA
jgi:hypothetical protein